MKIFGIEIKKQAKKQENGNEKERTYLSLYTPNLWTNIFSSTVEESTTGNWQRDLLTTRTSVLASSAVYACVTGISSDIAKLRIKLCRNEDGIWKEITENNPWLPLLRKPNSYQTTIQFTEQWILSKLLSGNTYVLKERDARGIVNQLYVLDPCRVTTLVSESGEIFYRLGQDYLSGVKDELVAPASEIIRDSMQGLFNPLIGTSPIFACSASAQLATTIAADSKNFFANRSLPGGMLTAPGRISDDAANRIKTSFEEKFGGANIGRLFVAGDGLKFEPIRMTAEQSMLVEQLKWAVSDVARAFHYPEFKLGGPLPPYSGNMEALTLSYYTDCLQYLIEAMEAALDHGLELPLDQGTELDTDNLLRMDTMSLYKSNSDAIVGGWMTPDEARFRANYSPVEGGDTPYLQQQNYSLAALAKRDAGADPFGKNQAAPAVPTPQNNPPALPAAREEDTEELDPVLCVRKFAEAIRS